MTCRALVVSTLIKVVSLVVCLSYIASFVLYGRPLLPEAGWELSQKVAQFCVNFTHHVCKLPMRHGHLDTRLRCPVGLGQLKQSKSSII